MSLCRCIDHFEGLQYVFGLCHPHTRATTPISSTTYVKLALNSLAIDLLPLLKRESLGKLLDVVGELLGVDQHLIDYLSLHLIIH